MRLALAGELVPDAVNVAGGVIDPYVRPGIPLVEKLGQLFAGLADAPITSLDVEVHGELVDYDVSVLKLAALKGVFTNVVSETVSLRERAAPRRAARHRRAPHHRRRSRPSTATSSRSRGALADGRSSRSRAR